VPDWKPVQTLRPVELHFPVPGTKEPFAVLRWVQLTIEGEPASRWRAVTYKEPRRLIGQGYFIELEDAAMACNREMLASLIPDALNDQHRGMGPRTDTRVRR
jgi:hypothetical protein